MGRRRLQSRLIRCSITWRTSSWGAIRKSLESAARAAKDLGYRTGWFFRAAIEGETGGRGAHAAAAIARQIRTYG